MRNKPQALTFINALADSTRLKIFLKIIELSATANAGDNPIVAENTAKNLAQIFGLAKSTVSHHIGELKSAGLVFEVVKGKFAYLFPDFTHTIALREFLDQQILPYYNTQIAKIGEYFFKSQIQYTHSQLELYMKDSLQTFGCRAIRSTTDISNQAKIYFKISGFLEPFFLLIGSSSISIWGLSKNQEKIHEMMPKLIEHIFISLKL